ncbi:MAG: primosomal protein N' [Elusimicrobium sp.]|jgi:primosomal protein N' (replication factor Y)|nr:primosomal protein N' [Elusimicrobium sp.]
MTALFYPYFFSSAEILSYLTIGNHMYCKIVFDIALDREFDYIIPAALAAAAAPGRRVRAPFGPRAALGMITAVSDSSDVKKLKEITEVPDAAQNFSADLFDLAHFMHDTWGGSLGQILFSLVPFFLKDISLSPRPGRERGRGLPRRSEAEAGEGYAQKSEITEILSSQIPVLLYGPGRSGKRDILISAAITAAQNGTVLILVPDILSCEVFAAQLQKYYDKPVSVWHSKIPAAAKKQIFAAALGGENMIIVGTRSAALLPLSKPALTACVNEEDADFKQEEPQPYFHARDILLRRAKTLGCPLAFLSQTPSLEMLDLVKRGVVREITLPHNADLQNPYPLVMTTAKAKGKKSFLPDVTFDEISFAAAQNKNILLISASRGGAPVYECLNCGCIARCAKCGGLPAFDENEKLKCLKCGTLAAEEQKCPKCANMIFRRKESGAQRAYGEIKKLFPAANILRCDVAPKARAAFENGKANIIIATRAALKMLREERAKIDLIVFLDADLELNSPDFRAAERSAQILFAAKSLLLGTPDAKMIITSDKLDSALINAVVHGEYKTFAEEEMQFRQAFNFPPYSALTRLTAAAKNAAEAENVLEEIKTAAGNFGEILGPIPCGKKTDKLKKKYILLKNIPLKKLREILSAAKPRKSVKLKTSADPYSFF